MVDCVHLRGSRLQLALVLGQCTSRPGVFAEEGQRVVYLPVIVCSRSFRVYQGANENSIFTFLGMFLEILALWSNRNEHGDSREKHNGAGRTDGSAPAESAA